MNYAAIKDFDIANGPGIRISLFVSGCPHHCPGCFNEETWDYNYGTPYGVNTEKHILALLAGEGISGLTLLGGEPMAPENVRRIAGLVTKCRFIFPEKTIWLYSGYTLENLLLRMGDIKHAGPNYQAGCDTVTILNTIDVLVDGPFVEDKKDLKLHFRGSSNQRIINMRETMPAVTALNYNKPVPVVLMDGYM